MSVLHACLLTIASVQTVQDQDLVDPTPATGETFGHSVSIWGDRAAVGVPEIHASNPLGGGVVVFVRAGSQWIREAELRALQPGIDDWFGHSVRIQGERIVVGAPGRDTTVQDAGALFVFELENGSWLQKAELQVGAPSTDLGEIIDLDGDLLVSAASGSLFPFRFDGQTWQPEGQLSSSGLFLGASLAVEGDLIVAGAPDDDVVVPFARVGSSWHEQAAVVPSVPDLDDEFGASVSLSGDRCAIGAPRFIGPAGTGAVYVFQRSGSTWTETALIEPSPAEPYDCFGLSVFLLGDLLLVGDDPFSPPLFHASVELFVARSGVWGSEQVFFPNVPKYTNDFGVAIATDGRRLLVGAPGANAGAGAGVPHCAAHDPLTDRLYGISSSDHLLILRPDFQSHVVGLLPSGNYHALALDPLTGTLYTVDIANDQLLTIDPSTVTATPVGPVGFANIRSLAFHSGLGLLYGVDAQTKLVVTIDPATGAATGLSTTGYAGIQGMTYDPVRQALFATDGSSGKLLTIDPITGGASEVGRVTAVSVGRALAYDPGADVLMGVASNIASLMSIDPDTAVPTVIGPLSVNDSGVAYDYGLDLTQSYCTPGTSASGCAATLSASGVASSTDPSGFVVSASGVEGATPGLFYFGTAGRQANPWGTSSSFQCVVPPVVRTGVMAGFGTSGQCDGGFSQDLNAVWCSTCPKAAVGPVPGQFAQLQLWYRDPQSSSNSTTGFSDALEVLVGL